MPEARRGPVEKALKLSVGMDDGFQGQFLVTRQGQASPSMMSVWQYVMGTIATG